MITIVSSCLWGRLIPLSRAFCYVVFAFGPVMFCFSHLAVELREGG